MCCHELKWSTMRWRQRLCSGPCWGADSIPKNPSWTMGERQEKEKEGKRGGTGGEGKVGNTKGGKRVGRCKEEDALDGEKE